MENASVTINGTVNVHLTGSRRSLRFFRSDRRRMIKVQLIVQLRVCMCVCVRVCVFWRCSLLVPSHILLDVPFSGC